MSSTNPPLTQDQPVTDPGLEPGSAELVESVAPVEADPADPAEPAQPDEVVVAAVELARQAAEETAEPNTVGDHLGVTVDEGGLTMHSFVCTARGYRGWRWAVTLAHVPGSDRVTVCDVVLLPGADSIMAPTWVPWSDRLAPGDLGAGDDLPYRADDPLLVPGYTITDPDDADQELFWELGLGRERVVGLEGLQAAADRWQHGAHGPTSEIAVQAAASCLTCAYFLPVSGFLRQHFGVCTNEWSPADGTVVTTDFGCGAHSETDLELPTPEPLPAHILDESLIEEVVVDREQVEAVQEPEAVQESEAVEESVAVLEPEAVLESEGVGEPVAVQEPEAVLEPEVVQVPVAVLEPEVVQVPVAVQESEAVQEPVAVLESEVAQVPEAVQVPVAVQELEVVQEPEPAQEPEPVQEPEAVQEPEPVQEPKAAQEPAAAQDSDEAPPAS